MMKRMLSLVLSLSMLGMVPAPAHSEEVASPSGQKTLAATMNIYVFPKEGQTADQQSKDEAECYDWASKNTGSDPFELVNRAEQEKKEAEEAKEEAKNAGKGEGAKSAVRGAAAGALIGEIASDDAGKGAAYGAAAGVIRGRRRSRSEKKQAEAAAEQKAQQAQQATQQQMDNFKKAFSVCLEAKDYLVKY
jgi:hypothetical protein